MMESLAAFNRQTGVRLLCTKPGASCPIGDAEFQDDMRARAARGVPRL